MTRWFVCDIDDGILRTEYTRRVAVRWLTFHLGGKVLRRRTYGPGRFEYVVGLRRDDDHDSAFIVREDRLTVGGWDPRQPPLYPFSDDPHKRVDREEIRSASR